MFQIQENFIQWRGLSFWDTQDQIKSIQREETEIELIFPWDKKFLISRNTRCKSLWARSYKPLVWQNFLLNYVLCVFSVHVRTYTRAKAEYGGRTTLGSLFSLGTMWISDQTQVIRLDASSFYMLVFPRYHLEKGPMDYGELAQVLL